MHTDSDLTVAITVSSLLAVKYQFVVSRLPSPNIARDSASAAILCMYEGARKIDLDTSGSCGVVPRVFRCRIHLCD